MTADPFCEGISDLGDLIIVHIEAHRESVHVDQRYFCLLVAKAVLVEKATWTHSLRKLIDLVHFPRDDLERVVHEIGLLVELLDEVLKLVHACKWFLGVIHLVVVLNVELKIFKARPCFDIFQGNVMNWQVITVSGGNRGEGDNLPGRTTVSNRNFIDRLCIRRLFSEKVRRFAELHCCLIRNIMNFLQLLLIHQVELVPPC
mmetsp:Transcript_15510/g.22735  ORF Transcript_15510/g.22735 Transcript_15510/m.22735 type:complete len:202 (-) Transcript_15510:329-934(-)